MRISLIVTFVGANAPGLVEKVAATVTAGHGNWLESRSTELGGRYAGLVRVGVDESDAQDLTRQLEALSDGTLHVAVETGEAPARHATSVQRLTLHILGLDRAGIIYEVTRALAALSINIVDLRTNVFAAAMSGEQMFEAEALVECGVGTAEAPLHDALDAISSDLGVDIDSRSGSTTFKDKSGQSSTDSVPQTASSFATVFRRKARFSG